jgi:hypothetical protein
MDKSNDNSIFFVGYSQVKKLKIISARISAFWDFQQPEFYQNLRKNRQISLHSSK